MGYWIALGVVVAALLALAILAFDVFGHLKRLNGAVATAQRQAQPQVQLLVSLIPTDRGKETDS